MGTGYLTDAPFEILANQKIRDPAQQSMKSKSKSEQD
jgi:hypothetical protein